MAVENYLYTSDLSMSIGAYPSLQIVRKTMSDNIAFVMAINTAHGKTLKRLGMACPPSPLPPTISMWHFLDPLH